MSAAHTQHRRHTCGNEGAPLGALRFVLLFAVTCALLTACASSPNKNSAADSAARKKAQGSGPQITLGGDGLNLGETQQTALTPDNLTQIITRLLAEGRFQSARFWVARYPDVVLDLLRDMPARQASDHAARFIATQYDELNHQSLETGWAAVLADRASHAAEHDAFQRVRGKVFAAIRAGKLTEAAAIDVAAAVPATAPGSHLRVEALRLQGIALLLHERADAAAACFEQAAELSRDDEPFVCANLLLLAGDARRRAGDAAAADGHWADAVAVGAALLAGADPIESPVFWERAAYLRPQSRDWPTSIAQPLARSLVDNPTRVWQSDLPTTMGRGDNASIECLLWANVGVWRLARQEVQGAMAALQRADVLAPTDALRDDTRLQMARALAQLGQRTAAMSLLVGLMTKPTPVGRSAMAVAGVMSVEQDQTQRGLSLLKRAVNADQTAPWPGRVQAQLDLGLACLILGDEDAGFETLHNAQQELANRVQDSETLIKSLRNEVRYLEAMGRKEERTAVASRLSALEQL